MKYSYAIVVAFCIFVLTSVNSYAQPLYPFPSPGLIQTEVYHQDWTQLFQIRNNSFLHTGDTIVASYNYSRFSALPVGSSNPWYTCYDNGRVYFTGNSVMPNPQSGTLLYDFSLIAGDTFFATAFSHYGNYVVSMVSTTTLLNSQSRKYMELVNGSDTLHWIDGIGDIEHGFFYSTDFEGGFEELVCVQDSTGPLYSVPNSPFYCNENDPTPNAGPNTCDQFSYNVQIVGTSCIGCDGYIAVSNITGGTPGYTYHWSNGATTFYASNLCQGPISLTIYDATGDSCTRTFYIGYNNVQALVTSPDVDHCDGIDTLCVNGSGGSAPYFYQWATGSTGSCEVFYVPGTYSVTVTDANGCTCTYTFTFSTVPIADNTQPQGTSCPGCCDGNVTLNFAGGQPPYTVTYPNGPWPAANGFCQGWYSYCVTDSLGCMKCDSVFVMDPLGVNSPQIDAFELYPNPANESFTLRSSVIGELVLITDVNAEVVKELRISSSSEVIDTRELPDGIYFVRMGELLVRLVICR